MILLKLPEPGDSLNITPRNEYDLRNEGKHMTYLPKEEEWRYASSQSKPSDIPSDEKPEEIGRFME